VGVDRSAGERGRQAVKPAGQRLSINFLHSYLRSPLVPTKYPIDVSGGITEWQMLGNGPDPTLTVNGGQAVGDCTFAARQHLRMAKAAAVGKVETWPTADELVREYLAYDHGADNGANIAEVLVSWFLTGKILAFAPVDHTDPSGCDAVMAAFHGLYVGVDLTANANSEFEADQAWALQPGERPDPGDRHCIVKVKADGQKLDTWVTWGNLQQSTREWTAACIREAWAIVTTEDEASKLNMPSLVNDIVAATKAVSASRPPTNQPNQAATTAAMGWQMAQLYGPLAADMRPDATGDHLRAVAEYQGAARGQLVISELKSLLLQAGLADVDTSGLDGWADKDAKARDQAVVALHEQILDSLAARDPAEAASYQLAAALSDTCWLPDTARQLPQNTPRSQVFFDQFGRDRLAELQGWLGTMSPLAPQTAPAVSRSLDNWANWIATNRSSLQKDWGSHEAPVVAALRMQAQAWYGWLSSQNSDASALPTGAWVHAGEQILRTAHTLTVRMLRWFWPAVVVLLAVTGGLLYLAISNATETAKVWTSLVAVAGSAGVAIAGLRTGAKRLATGLEHTMWEAATIDALAWNITWLPTLQHKRLDRYLLHYRLRKVGVDPPGTQ
jgi:hypothetical protein